jgi:hypothetical protein
MIELGSKVRDQVSGFEGIATSRCEFINGCIQYGIRPTVGADGKIPDTQYLDEQHLVVIGPGVIATPRPTGGPPMQVRRSEVPPKV